MGLTYDEATRNMFVNNLKAKMSEYNLETVYLASPPNVSFFLLFIFADFQSLEHWFDSFVELIFPR